MSDAGQANDSFWKKFGWIVIFDVFLFALLVLVLLGFLNGWTGFAEPAAP